jgi:hypothetical protein
MLADKRSDISVTMPGRKLLCVVKRDYHADLWTAAAEQLERFDARHSWHISVRRSSMHARPYMERSRARMLPTRAEMNAQSQWGAQTMRRSRRGLRGRKPLLKVEEI